MEKEAFTMHQRVNVTLPEETLQLIDRVAQKGDRSRFIDRAVRYYIGQVGRTNLKNQLKEGAVRRAERDLSLSQEYFGLEEELWHAKRA
jgi:CopG family transcriptional regulator/antitoxin EndoAI